MEETCLTNYRIKEKVFAGLEESQKIMSLNGKRWILKQEIQLGR